MESLVKYPTRNGIPIPVAELDLPESKLDCENPKNIDKHHRLFPARKFGRNILYRTLRDLEALQDDIPIDTHTLLHNKYKAPNIPTVAEALSEIMRAAEAGEYLVYKTEVKKGVNIYVRKQIGEAVLRRVIKKYDEITP